MLLASTGEMKTMARFLGIGILLAMASCTGGTTSSFTPPQVLPLAKTIKLPGQAVTFTAAAHSVWVMANHAGRSRLWRVPGHADHVRGQGRTLPFHAISAETVMTSERHMLWIAATRRGGSPGKGGLLIKFDPSRGAVLSRTLIPASPTAIAVVRGDVWIAIDGAKRNRGRLLKIDASTGKVLHQIRGLEFPDVIASGPTALWAGGVNGDLWRIDPNSYRVKHYPGDQYLQEITKSSMWLISKGVERRDPATGKVLTQSSPLPCSPSRVIATETRAWVVHCVKIGPDPLPEGPPQIAWMVFGYDMSDHKEVGPPIPLKWLLPPQSPFFAFGSIWSLSYAGVQKIDSPALSCQVNPSCVTAKETRFHAGDR